MPATKVDAAAEETSQTVVVVRTDVVTFPTGQLVTVGGQEVMVYSMVVSMVEVVYGVTVAAAEETIFMLGLGNVRYWRYSYQWMEQRCQRPWKKRPQQ